MQSDSLNLLYKAMEKGASATRGFLQAARQMEPGDRQRLIGEIEYRQKSVKCAAEITVSSAKQLQEFRERQYRNPVIREMVDARENNITESTLASMDAEHAMLGGIAARLKALDVDVSLLEELNEPQQDSFGASIDRSMTEQAERSRQSNAKREES